MISRRTITARCALVLLAGLAGALSCNRDEVDRTSAALEECECTTCTVDPPEHEEAFPVFCEPRCSGDDIFSCVITCAPGEESCAGEVSAAEFACVTGTCSTSTSSDFPYGGCVEPQRCEGHTSWCDAGDDRVLHSCVDGIVVDETCPTDHTCGLGNGQSQCIPPHCLLPAGLPADEIAAIPEERLRKNVEDGALEHGQEVTLGGVTYRCPSCPTGSFQCPSGQCIPSDGVCNGVAECSDGADEATALCQECGNGLVEGDEACDGADLGGQSCQGLGYAGGTLSCRPWCEIDETACTAAYCGDGVREGSEACDGDDLGGATCGDLGYPGGTLACSGICELDPSGCTGLDAGVPDAGMPGLDAGMPSLDAAVPEN